MNNDEARQYFKDKGLTYDVLSTRTISLLAGFLQGEIMEMKNSQDDCILTDMNKCKFTKKHLSGNFSDGISLTVKGSYFDDREAVTFSCSGFIGFAGWASGCNTKPFIDGFIKWCDFLVENLASICNGCAQDCKFDTIDPLDCKSHVEVAG